MKRKIIMALLATSLSLTTPVYADMFSVDFNGISRNISYNEVVDNIVMVNGEELAKYLNLGYEYKLFEGTIILSDRKDLLTMKLGETKASFNGEEVTLSVAPKRVGNNSSDVLLPIVSIAEIFGSSVSYDKDGNIENIYRNSSFSSVLEGFGVTEGTKVYTYDEALKRAIKNSSSIKTAQMQFDEIEQGIEDLQDVLNATPNYVIIDAEGNKIDFMYSTIRDLYIKIQSAESSFKLKDDTIAITEMGIELGLITILNNLETLNMNYILTLESLELQEISLKNTRLRNSLGLVSDNDLKTAENAYTQAKSSIATIESTIDDLKLSLNSLLGNDLTVDSYVEYNVEVLEADINVEKVVTKALENSFNIKQAETTLENARKALTYTISLDDKDAKVRTYDRAALALEDSKKEVEKKVRTTYSSYLQYIENDKTLKIDRENAVDTYNTVLINYKIGYVTEYELKAAELNITSCDAKILQNKLAYKLSLFSLEHPELF